jgi:outer membrane protein assembly factor BamB
MNTTRLTVVALLVCYIACHHHSAAAGEFERKGEFWKNQAARKGQAERVSADRHQKIYEAKRKKVLEKIMTSLRRTGEMPRLSGREEDYVDDFVYERIDAFHEAKDIAAERKRIAEVNASKRQRWANGDLTVEEYEILARAEKRHDFFNSRYFPTPKKQFRSDLKARRYIESRMTTQPTDYGFEIDIGAKKMMTPTVAGDKILVCGRDTFHCFKADTGKTVWSVKLDDPEPTTASVADDVLVFNTYSCTLYAIVASTGKLLWSRYLASTVVTAPAIVNGQVIVSYPETPGPYIGRRHTKLKMPTHVLTSFDLKSGEVKWQSWLDSELLSAPVGQGSEVYGATSSGKLYAFSASKGKLLSVSDVGALAVPAVGEEEVHYAVRDPETGEKGFSSTPRRTGESDSEAEDRGDPSLARAAKPVKFGYEGRRLAHAVGRDIACLDDDVHCYGYGDAVDFARWVERTEGASPAFIEELTKKAILFAAERADGKSLRLNDSDFDEAIHELVVFGGDLTRDILGFPGLEDN